MKPSFTSTKYKSTKIFFLKKNKKYVENIKKAIQIIEILDKNLYKEIKSIKKILILDIKTFDSSLAYKEEKTVVMSTKCLNESVLWVAGGLVHEARHIRQPKSKENDYYWCEMNATKGELELFKSANDSYYYDWANPKTKRKKYFKTLKSRQKRKVGEVYKQLEDFDQKELEKVRKIVDSMML